MVLYFSATGNSRFIAQEIAKALGTSAASITPYTKEEIGITQQGDDPVIIVSPIFAWRIPKIVEDFIERSDFGKGRNISYVVTCGGSPGNANAYARKTAQKSGYTFKGLQSFVMPDNYIIMYNPESNKLEKLSKEALIAIPELANRIREGREIGDSSTSILARLLSFAVTPGFRRFSNSSSRFHVSDQCTSCGLCEKLCPTGNIELIGGKPKWNNKCTHCTACINNCPEAAIEYGKNTVGRNRYIFKIKTEINN